MTQVSVSSLYKPIRKNRQQNLILGKTLNRQTLHKEGNQNGQ